MRTMKLQKHQFHGTNLIQITYHENVKMSISWYENRPKIHTTKSTIVDLMSWK